MQPWVCNLDPPPSANNLFASAGKRRIKTREYKAWIDASGWALKLEGGSKIPGRAFARCEIAIRVPINASRDLGNYEKPICDLLVSMGVIATDRMTCLRKIVLEPADHIRLCEVTITPWGLS